MKLSKNIAKLVMTPIIAFGLGKGIKAQDSTNVEKSKISFGGWTEITAGINQGNNLRIYPSLNAYNFKINTLADFNKFYSFSKNDLSHTKLEKKIGKNVVLKPVATIHTNPFEKKITGDLNLTAFTDQYFGFFEIDANPLDIKNPEFFTYHNIGTKIGNFGLFATGKIRDIKNTYVELEFTGKEIKKTGISPYARANLMKGTKPTYQLGMSFNPWNFVSKISKKR